MQEAKAASALNHPNIVHIYDIADADGVQFIAMEYVAGKTLDQLIGRKGLPLHETLKYAIQIADALAAAHAAGIVHRDLKPSNLMVTDKGLVKVLDFGLAKLTETTTGEAGETATITAKKGPHTEEGTILGTIAYMSPEQAEARRVDARSDIFSFGSVLYEMVTGRRAFQRDSKLETLSAILKDDPKPASSITPEVPPDLEKLISRCLRKDPNRRFQHMADVKVALEELKEESDSGKLPGVTATGAGKWHSRLMWAGGVAVILILVAIGVWFLRPAPHAVPKTVPLTSYPGRQVDPALSPDGKQVAFAWDGEKGENFDIYVKLVDAGAPLRLTSSPANEGAPAWSPDTRYLAFCRELSDHVEIWMVPALGGAERKLGESAGCRGLSWSPDGKFLALVDKKSPQAPYSIFLLSVETGERRGVTSPPSESWGEFDPRYSPDGKTIGFVRASSDGRSDLYSLPVSTDGRPRAEPRRLTFEGRIFGLDWTADGRRIVFAWESIGGNLWVIPASGGTPERLSVAAENAANPSIARTGSRLVYQRGAYDSNIWRIPGPNATDRRSAPARFIASTQGDIEPQFSPDGEKIAFGSNRSGNEELWVCDSEGHNPVQLTTFGGPGAGCPRWSPDGRWIAFDNSKAGNSDIYIISADGGPPRRLTAGPSNNMRPSWSRDARWIYFGSNRSGDLQIWKQPAQGGTAVQVTKSGGEEAFESGDGKFVYWAKPRVPGIWRMPVQGGDETRVVESSAESLWYLTDEGIYFFNVRTPAGPSLNFYNPATHKATLLRQFSKETKIDVNNNALTVSPDGRWILYTQFDRTGSDLMLVENFQ